MPRRTARRFARVAIRFASLAPALGPSPAPVGGAHAEVGPEGSREGGGGGKAVVERDRQDAPLAVVHQGAGGPLEPKPLDEREERLTADRPEDPVEVKGREGGNPGEALEGQV